MNKGPLSIVLGATLLSLVACGSQPVEVRSTSTPITIPSPTLLYPATEVPPTVIPTDEPDNMIEVPDLPHGSVVISPEAEAHTKNGRIIVQNNFEHQKIDDHNIYEVMVQFNQITFESLLNVLDINPVQTIVTVEYSADSSSVQVEFNEDDILTITVKVKEINDFNYEIIYAMVHDRYPEWDLQHVHQVTSALIHAATGKTYAEYTEQLERACVAGFTDDCGEPVSEPLYEQYNEELAGANPLFIVFPTVIEIR